MGSLVNKKREIRTFTRQLQIWTKKLRTWLNSKDRESAGNKQKVWYSHRMMNSNRSISWPVPKAIKSTQFNRKMISWKQSKINWTSISLQIRKLIRLIVFWTKRAVMWSVKGFHIKTEETQSTQTKSLRQWLQTSAQWTQAPYLTDQVLLLDHQ